MLAQQLSNPQRNSKSIFLIKRDFSRNIKHNINQCNLNLQLIMGLMTPNLTELLPAPWYPHHGCLSLGFTQRSTTDISVLDIKMNTAIFLLQRLGERKHSPARRLNKKHKA